MMSIIMGYGWKVLLGVTKAGGWVLCRLRLHSVPNFMVYTEDLKTHRMEGGCKRCRKDVVWRRRLW